MEAAVFCIYCGTPTAPLATVTEPKPGKGHGIRSLFWGAVGWLAILASLLIYVWVDLSADPAPESLLVWVADYLSWLGVLFAIAGVVYGILGRNTEGWRYAYTGLVLSALVVQLALIAYIVLDGILH